jgi:hypothetical protein
LRWRAGAAGRGDSWSASIRNDVLEQAMVRHAIDVAADDLGMLAEVDLVVLCAPVEACIAICRGRLTRAAGAVITDVGSTKRSVGGGIRALRRWSGLRRWTSVRGAARSGYRSTARLNCSPVARGLWFPACRARALTTRVPGSSSGCRDSAVSHGSSKPRRTIGSCRR